MILAPCPRPVPEDYKSQLKWLDNFKNDKTPEGIDLDYKHGNALNNLFSEHYKGFPKKPGGADIEEKPMDQVIQEARSSLFKDVSGFANAGGGLLLYGINEKVIKPGKRRIPKNFAPVEKSLDPERIAQLLNANIKPRVEGCKIVPIDLPENDGYPEGCCVAIEVPQSAIGHQADDKLYYRRHLTEIRIMEDFEIREVMNRTVHPDVNCEISMYVELDSEGKHLDSGVIRIRIFNSSLSVFCKKFHCLVVFPYWDNRLKDADSLSYDGHLQLEVPTAWGTGLYSDFSGQDLYPGSVKDVDFRFYPCWKFTQAVGRRRPFQLMAGKILVRLFADGMRKKEYTVTVKDAEAQWGSINSAMPNHWLSTSDLCTALITQIGTIYEENSVNSHGRKLPDFDRKWYENPSPL